MKAMGAGRGGHGVGRAVTARSGRVLRTCGLTLLVALTPGTALAASVVTGSATSVTGSKATLSSQVTLDGQVDRCYFQVKKETKQATDTTTPVPCSSGTFRQDAALDSAGGYIFRAAVCESRGTVNGCPFGPAVLASNSVAFTAPGPTAVMGSAIPANGTEATVTAAVDGQGNPGITTYIQYSLDPTFQTFEQILAGPAPTIGTPKTTISAKLTNLAPATTYYARARVIVENAVPQDYYSSDVKSFLTGRYARTLPATSVAGTTATLNGEVNAADVTLSYHWFYGPDQYAVSAATSPATPAQSAAPSGGTVPVSTPVTGLTQGTTYYAKLVATYIDPASKQPRTISGDVVGFGTRSVTCPAGQVDLEQAALPGTSFVASGCFDGSATTPSAPFAGHGTVLLNGLTFTPKTSNGVLRLDPATRKITTTLPTSIAIGTTNLRNAGTAPFSTTWSSSDSTFTVGGLDLSSKLLGFPLGGTLSASPVANGATIVVSALGLPNQLGGVTADAHVDIDGTGAVQKATAQLGGAQIGPILLPSLSFEWLGQRTWKAVGDLRIPLLEQGIGATITVTDNKVVGLSMSFASPIGVPLGASGVELDYIAASAEFEPPGFTLGGELGGSAGPSIGKFSLLRLDAKFQAAVAREAVIPAGLGSVGLTEGKSLGVVPFAFSVGGTFKLLNVLPVGSAFFYYWGTPKGPLVALKGDLGFDFNVGSCGALSSEPAFQVKFGAFVGVAFNKSDFAIAAGGEGKVRFLCATILDLGAEVRVSKKGLAVCGYIKTVFGKAAGGVGTAWPSGEVTSRSLLDHIKPFVGCDLSKYTSDLTTAVASQAGARTVRLPGGLPSAVLRVTGRGGAPRVQVRAPDGRIARVDADGATVDRQEGIVVLTDGEHGHHDTYVQFVRPKAGTYRVKALPGSTVITSVTTAQGLAPAAVKATVSGRGAVRTLRWRATGVRGQSLVFRERGPGGDRVLVRTTKARGTLRFRPALGYGGKRTIAVDVFNQGFARKTLRPATFTVAAPARPSKVAKLRLVRKGSTVRVTWLARGAAVDHYEIALTLGDGRKLLKLRHARSVTVRGVGRRVSVAATVRGADGLDRRGPTVRGKLAR